MPEASEFDRGRKSPAGQGRGNAGSLGHSSGVGGGEASDARGLRSAPGLRPPRRAARPHCPLVSGTWNDA